MWLFWIALLAMIVALPGVFLPFFPDLIVIWVVALIYAIAEGFAAIDPRTFIGLTLLAGLGLSAELCMSYTGAKLGGASNRSLVIGLLTGVLGGVVGLVFLGVGLGPGALLGGLAGLLVSEWYWRRDWGNTLRIVGGWLGGYMLSVGFQLVIGITMILVFAWQVLSR